MDFMLARELVLAYFDPGAGSLVLQSLVGGVAGFLVFGQYIWTRLSERVRNRK